MPRERTGIDYSTLPDKKPGAKRDKSEGREQHNSTLRSYTTLQASKTPLKSHGRSEEIDGPQCEAARMLPCAICGAPPPSDPHHDPKVSQGGLDVNAGPLCREHHEESETMALSKFRRKYGLDWREVCESVRAWMNAGYPQGSTPWGRR